MPELPEVEAVRRRLEPAMRGARISHVLLRRKNLRRPFPRAFASRLEALHLARLSPLRRSSTLTTRAGRPNTKAVRLAAAIKTVLQDAIARKERPYRAGRFRVYDREGERCPTSGCRGRIRRISQAGRS